MLCARRGVYISRNLLFNSLPPSFNACRIYSPLRSFATAATNVRKIDLSSSSNEYIKVKAADPSTLAAIPSSDLEVYPDFLSSQEQGVLLSAALKKLDAMASREERKKRREWNRSQKGKQQTDAELKDFLPDEIYEFEQRHFDGVISGYRETTLSEWIPFHSEELNESLKRILSKTYLLMLKPQDVQVDSPLHTPSKLLTHLLHLSSSGYILPHVDNIEASAGTIMGICLGAERDLLLQSTSASNSADEIRVRLPAGCVYIQRGQIRYGWKHSIPEADDSVPSQRGHRLSVMIRDRLS